MDAVTELAGYNGSFTWTHYNMGVGGADRALATSGLDHFVLRALTAEETRPRCTAHGDGVLLNLRGVNLNPGAETEDMVSLRLWVTGDRVVSVQFRRLMAIGDVMEGFSKGKAPDGPVELVARLALRLADRAEPVVADLNERIDELEESASEGGETALRGKLADLRRQAIIFRRYMFPQRDALSSFEIEEADWIRPIDRSRLREATERVTRLAEELDAIRDRAQLVQEQIADARAERLNRQMLVLSVVAALFLPLGLLTGLLGINVAGIPGSQTPWAFWAVCGLLVLLALFQLWIFRRIGLIGSQRD